MRETLGLAVVALASLAAAAPALEEMWRLPLGLGQGVLVAGPDAMYTADARGAVFAIGAANGTLRWSWPGSSNVLPTTVIAFDAVAGPFLWQQVNILGFDPLPAGSNVTVDEIDGRILRQRADNNMMLLSAR